MGDVSFAMPGVGTVSQDARVYVRPHLLDVHATGNGQTAFAARLMHVSGAGPLVTLELTAAWGEPLRVEMPRERFRTRGLERGRDVVVTFAPSDIFVSPEGWGELTRGSGEQVALTR